MVDYVSMLSLSLLSLSLSSLSLSVQFCLFVLSVGSVSDEKAIHVRKVCACVLDGEESRVFASRALVVVVVWTAVYQTVYSNCMTGFCEPLSPVRLIDATLV